MANISALERKTSRLVLEAHRRLPDQAYKSVFCLDLHSSEERARLEPFKRRIEEKLNTRKYVASSDYTEHEQDEILLWLNLEEAIERGDERDAQAWRHWLQYTPEQVIEQFLAMPESSIPEQAHRQVGYAVYNARKLARENQQRFTRWYEEGNLSGAASFSRAWLAAFLPEHALGRWSEVPEWVT